MCEKKSIFHTRNKSNKCLSRKKSKPTMDASRKKVDDQDKSPHYPLGES